MKVRGVAFAVSLWPGLVMSAAAGADMDADRACARLIEAARARQWAGADKRCDYACEPQREASEHLVFALRWRGDGLPATGSNLVGYYLVDAASGGIHEWDLGEGRRGCAIDSEPRPPPQDECESACARRQRSP